MRTECLGDVIEGPVDINDSGPTATEMLDSGHTQDHFMTNVSLFMDEESVHSIYSVDPEDQEGNDADADKANDDDASGDDDMPFSFFAALEGPARDVRSHAYWLLTSLNMGIGSGDASTSTASGSANDVEEDEKDHDVDLEDEVHALEKSLAVGGTKSGKKSLMDTGKKVKRSLQKNPRFMICGCLILFALIGVIVLLALFLMSPISNTATNASSDLSPQMAEDQATSATMDPTAFSTIAPTVPYDGKPSTTCQTLTDRDTAQVWEAETASILLHETIVNQEAGGFCGTGYVSGLSTKGARFVLGHVEVLSSGYFTARLRYSNPTKENQEIILSVDSIPVAFFNMTHTPDSSTWKVVSVAHILLNEGPRYVEVWTRKEHEAGGPNIDWVAIELQKELTRPQYVTKLLPQLKNQSTFQASALEWLSESDSTDWESLSNHEIVERYALVEFFHSTYGDLWSNDNDSWLSTSHVCDWYGIVCNSRKMVTDVALDDNGLFGPVPSDLSLLSELLTLSLSKNHIEGTIGTEIGKFKKLTKLSLGGNFLWGSIPSEIAMLTNLHSLVLNANRLTGAMPNELLASPKLQKHLTVLSLESNALSGTLSDTMGQMSNLHQLLLGFNALTGTIPSQLGLLSNLSLLDLRSNQFDGDLPIELNQLTITEVKY